MLIILQVIQPVRHHGESGRIRCLQTQVGVGRQEMMWEIFIVHNYCCRPEYGHHGHHGGPPGGVEDKWRHTYPYVPTSYYYNNPNPPRQNPESIGD